jgi:chemotaxis protein MotB
MAAKCKKCDPHEICEECPEWIFTLADLIMCMMGLFVLLWVLKESGSKAETPEQAKAIEGIWLKGFQEGFAGYIPTDMTQQKPLINLNGPGAQGKAEIDPTSPEGTDDQSSVIRPGREVTTGGRLLFARGEAAIEPDLKRKLDKVADLIRGHRQVVQIKGHTSRDDLPLDASDAVKMNLSLKRAQVVADYLISRGVEPEVLRIQGCSNFEPVRQGDSTPAGQSLNRRVEVFASDTLVDALQDRQRTGAPVKPAASN